ncbi:hypothetical protein C4569_00995 [Candidatus Parcubacteria bacterium]|nr:MAG: hypothetical protein C4569_00995 [Candidatus Parcubacteria bacterium]
MKKEISFLIVVVLIPLVFAMFGMAISFWDYRMTKKNDVTFLKNLKPGEMTYQSGKIKYKYRKGNKYYLVIEVDDVKTEFEIMPSYWWGATEHFDSVDYWEKLFFRARQLNVPLYGSDAKNLSWRFSLT